MSPEPSAGLPPASSRFLTTQWSLVAGCQNTDSAVAQEALAGLCQLYWYPLYAFIRRTVQSHDDALDLTQGFFSHLIEKDVLAHTDRNCGKFRTYLLACCRNYLSHQREAARAQKRGGGKSLVSLDAQQAEHRYLREPVERLTPETLYLRRWALSVLENAFLWLEQEYQEAGRGDLYRALRGVLAQEPDAPTYGTIATALNLTEAAVKKAAQRMRERYGELLRLLVAGTVETPEEVEQEIQELRALLVG